MTQPKNYFFIALIPILVLLFLLYLDVQFFGEDSSYGSNQIALLGAATVAGLLGMVFKITWKKIYDGIVDSIMSAMGAILILLMIGSLAGTWLLSGVIPSMIYYGLEILNPTIFLVASCIICSVVSLATGSSWGTVATVGVALLGIGSSLGISEGWIAGSIISGAYFGDKMSPLSDTTNLAPAIAGTDLFTHIRYMFYTTIPSITVAVIVFIIAGFTMELQSTAVSVEELQTVIQSHFNIHWALFIVPIAVIVMIVKKMPAAPALFFGSLLGGIVAIIAQPEIVMSFANEGSSYAGASYMAVMTAMATNISIETVNPVVTDLLSAKGMWGMMNTVWLIICALTFGGVMQATGMLRAITVAILRIVNSVGSLITSTAITCGLFNWFAMDQYLAIVVPGKMFKEAYEKYGLAPENLSRTLEDSGTVTSVLFPYNTCALAQSSVLGVATGTYWMYCVFNLVSPLMTIMFGILGIKIKKLAPSIGSDGEIEKD